MGDVGTLDCDLYPTSQIGRNVEILTLVQVPGGQIVKYAPLITVFHKIKGVLVNRILALCFALFGWRGGFGFLNRSEL